MLRFVLAAALGFSALAVSQMTVTADDKKEDKKATTLEGKLVCTKCKLSETEACGNALLVKEGDKTITYYFKDNGKAEKYHKCSGEQAATVTGKVVEKDKKKYIEEAKVVKK